MPTPFDLDLNVAKQVLLVTTRGFWTDEVADAFDAAIADAIDHMGEGGKWSFLCDASDFPVQSAAMIARSQIGLGKIATRCAGRMAIVISGALTSFQAQRATAAQGVPVFRTKPEALRFLADAVDAEAGVSVDR